MKQYRSTTPSVTLFVILGLQPIAVGALVNASEVVYQAQIFQGSETVSGKADFRFSLWTEPINGTQIGAAVIRNSVAIVDGMFEVRLDFGVDAWRGSRWLAIEIDRPSGNGNFVPIPTRQKINSSPYSLQTRGIVVDDALNVGIGTSTSKAKLHVEAASAPGRLEKGLKTQVDDAPDDHFQIRNWTNWDGRFYAFLWGHHETDDRNALQFLATTDPASDTGSEAMMVFKAFLWDGATQSGPIGDRPLFSWVNLFFRLMTLHSDGQLAVGDGDAHSKLNLDLGLNNTDGIFLAKTGTSLGTRLAVRGSNNQEFGIDLDPYSGTGFEQFEITFNGGPAVFVIDDDGYVGVGTSSPAVPLHIEGGTTASVTGGGYLQARGRVDDRTVVFDHDSILSRIEQRNLVLEINADGGTVVFGGDIEIDVNVVRSPSVAHVVWAICPEGHRVLSGGCEGDGDKVEISRPGDLGNSWLCQFASTFTNPDADGFAWAICANVQ